MEMKTGLQTTLQQRLAMTPRLQQALKLLQVPTLELQQILKQELQENPMLEEVDDVVEAEDDAELKPQEDTAAQEESKVDWEDFWNDTYDSSFRGSERRPEDYQEKVPVTKVGLRDLLENQLRQNTSSPGEIEIGDFIIGCIDDDGYMRVPLEEVARDLGVDLEDVEQTLELMQTFDPAGVGARSRQECLLIQLKTRGIDNSVAEAIIRDHFQSFLQRRYADIAKALKVTAEQIQAAADVIATLNPNPGAQLSGEEPQYVIPDLIVERVNDDYEVFLNDKNVPRLRISSRYRELLRQNKGRKDAASAFIQGKLNSAKWLIQTIEQRRRTMVKVMRCIVDEQREFLDRGIAHLRPLTLQQVAGRIGMHESTVSRVTSNKYVQTPRGVFLLKYFFSSSLETDGGEDVSAKSVRNLISELINGEDKKTPLSDQAIADKLHDGGFRIARRTVAKYREQMNILSARQRRRY
jgi:RNA polymerase sigma-54 factor